MNFANAMYREGSTKLTENGAYAYNSTAQGAILDMFSQIGALRSRSEQDIIQKFAAAYREDALLATKLMFYGGDIREGGTGERRTFRICLRWLAENHSNVVIKNLELIPYFNRFDSLFVLVGTKCESAMWEFVNKTLIADVRAMKASKREKYVPITLLAKWMPSENASSHETRNMAHKAMKALSINPRSYRRMLSALRKHIDVVERRMAAGEWSLIDYSKVPSYAMKNYGSAFAKHDYERFNAYIKSVEKGEVKINASTLFPYDLVEKYMNSGYYGVRAGDCMMATESNSVVEAQWKALPNYITKPMNAVVMADVSGSMRGRPMATSIGLAIYFAQHNKGHYHNQYMTFTSSPKFVNIQEGASLYDCVKQVASAGVGYSTNLEAGFRAILDTAMYYRVPKNQMPEALIVISDMEINSYMRPGRHWDFVDVWRAKFEAAGYNCPKIIMWNVEARKDTFLSQSEDVLFISGQSAAAFKHLCNNLNGITAYDLMLQVLNGPAYAKVRI